MKKLLIFVNKFDEDDDLLGFFVGWINELAKHPLDIVVVTQHAGRYNCPSNVRVVDIDKKSNPSSIQRVLKFWKVLWQNRANYSHVIIIMAPAWAIIASLATKILHKKIYLWYAVWHGNWKLRLAEKLCDKILCSVKEAFPFETRKLTLLGQGINTDHFVLNETVRETGKILFLGRISPVK